MLRKSSLDNSAQIDIKQTLKNPFPNKNFCDDIITGLSTSKRSWDHSPGKTTHVTYGFPTSTEELTELLAAQDDGIDYKKGLNAVTKYQTSIIKMIDYWANTLNVVYTQVDKNAQIPIYEFTPKNMTRYVEGYGVVKGVAGYAFYPFHSNSTWQRSYGVAFNKKSFHRNSQLGLQLVNVNTEHHEISHAFLGFDHPFSGNLIAEEKLTTASSLNYKSESLYYFFTLLPVTPMPCDIEGAQRLYGQNQTSGIGDTFYYLPNLLPPQSFLSWLAFHPVVSLPWDCGGIDTISAKNVKSTVTLNLNPYSRSQLQNSFIAMPNMIIENVIGGNKRNRIILNQANNIVDIRHAEKTATIISDPQACGHDIILGFNPYRDQLIFRKGSERIDWKLSQIQSQHINLHGEKIKFDGLKIELNANNSIVLAGNILKLDILLKTDKEIEKLLWDLANNLPKELFDDFITAFLQGSLITFILCLTEQILKKYHCTDKQIAAVNQVAQCLLIVVTGNIFPASISFAVNSMFRYFNYTDRTSQDMALVFSKMIETGLTVTSYMHLLDMVVAMIGIRTGADLTLWGFNHMRNYVTKQKKCFPCLDSFSNHFSIWANSAKEKVKSCFNSSHQEENSDMHSALSQQGLGV